MGFRYQNQSAIAGVKMIFILFFLSLGLAFFIVTPALADQSNTTGTDVPATPPAASLPSTGLGKAFDNSPGSPLNVTVVQGGFNTSATFNTIISKVITMVLELIGVIFLILAIYGGFKWMMAGGNEEEVEKSKKIIINAIVGLVVVLASYLISRFIVEMLGGTVFKA